MPNRLPSADQKPTAVREMFDRIAPRYDFINRVMTGGMDRRWRRWVFRSLGVTARDVVLDLACGTGDFALLARERSARVIALDFSREMLRRARMRAGSGADFVRADALRLPLADGSVTVAVSGFALRNLASIPPVLGELARVTRPGGRLGLLEVDRPRNRLIAAGHGFYFGGVVPFVGGMLADRRAYRYLPDSVAYLPAQNELLGMVAEAGFINVQKRTFLGGAAQAITAVRGEPSHHR
jgi:demethylmenaquinone methyltransferase/2-methoxy-6-polyprenyl-1,4-benzoquinol methylase